MEAVFPDGSFWDKVKRSAKKAGSAVIEAALKLYYAANDPETPMWAKIKAHGALLYFVSPIDAIPDPTPGVGYVDDAGVLALALASIAAYVKPEHVQKAKETLKSWFG